MKDPVFLKRYLVCTTESTDTLTYREEFSYFTDCKMSPDRHFTCLIKYIAQVNLHQPQILSVLYFSIHTEHLLS
jgi:hypothetical protein